MIKEKLAKLIDLKSIISVSVIGASIYLVIVDKIDPVAFMVLVSSIVTYYFTRKDA